MNKRSIIGVLIIAVGLLMLGGALDYIQIDGGMWSTFWPVILIAIGFINLADGNRNYFFSGLMLGFGTLFLLRNLNVGFFADADIWAMVWPVIIIVVGLWFLTSKKRISIGGKMETSDDVVDNFALFSGANNLNRSQDFQGGQATAIFGGVDLDLRQANITKSPVKMDVFAAFGGVDIKVPEHWRVKVTGIPIFGGWGNKTVLKGDTGRPVDLEINCMVLFGGFDVKN